MSGHQGASPPILWEPSPTWRSSTCMGRFVAWLDERHGRSFTGFDDLHAWSVEDLGAFWSALASFMDLHWRAQPRSPLGRRGMPGTEWFPGGQLSYSEHAMRAGATRPSEPAVISVSQTRDAVCWSWAELAHEAACLRSWLVDQGVRRGDRVAAYLPNVAETLAAFVATASLGATWVSCAPEFGVRSVVDRLGQVEPAVLLAVDGYRYGAKAVDRRRELASLRGALPSLRAVLHLPYLDEAPVPGTTEWEQARATSPGALEHEAVPFDHPLYVLFSSGTTGLPKAIVHTTGGIVLEHWKTLALHHDLGAGDRFFWFTTTGWMMWNYLASSLLVGATAVCFDGDPGWPDLGTVWRLAGDHGVGVVGTSAPFLLACRKAGLHPAELADLSHVRQVASTGAPLPPEGFRWVVDELPGVQVSNISGGTDVCTAFVGMNPLTPVWEGEISRPLLGCDVDAAGPGGGPVPVGDEGELVVRSPMPSMPRQLWGDPDGAALRAAYYEQTPGAWTHGDWIRFTPRGSCVISGRSDATLNRSGVRMGTADLYAVVEAVDGVRDSLVVHLQDEDELWLFVVVEGGDLDDRLRAAIVGSLRRDLSPRHVPDRMVAVPTVPRTLSGKKLEVPVKRILLGATPESVASEGALADPRALEPYVALARSRAAPIRSPLAEGPVGGGAPFNRR